MERYICNHGHFYQPPRVTLCRPSLEGAEYLLWDADLRYSVCNKYFLMVASF